MRKETLKTHDLKCNISLAKWEAHRLASFSCEVRQFCQKRPIDMKRELRAMTSRATSHLLVGLFCKKSHSLVGNNICLVSQEAHRLALILCDVRQLRQNRPIHVKRDLHRRSTRRRRCVKRQLQKRPTNEWLFLQKRPTNEWLHVKRDLQNQTYERDLQKGPTKARQHVKRALQRRLKKKRLHVKTNLQKRPTTET